MQSCWQKIYIRICRNDNDTQLRAIPLARLPCELSRSAKEKVQSTTLAMF